MGVSGDLGQLNRPRTLLEGLLAEKAVTWAYHFVQLPNKVSTSCVRVEEFPSESMPLKRRRFNWKARQQARGETTKTSKPAYAQVEGLLAQIDAKRDSYLATVDETDSNALVLPPKRRKTHQEKDQEKDLGSGEPKHSKLSSRERKKLKKIVEAKAKKTKVSWLF